ncbi:hypothetical protein GOODEAATRI_015941 [Goodea atripinnis]|uniref:Uncharacterized protein n=1 Tax=Goodea atripinnis TaxID=208336 RepID=A0ABV0MSF1_9TELE
MFIKAPQSSWSAFSSHCVNVLRSISGAHPFNLLPVIFHMFLLKSFIRKNVWAIKDQFADETQTSFLLVAECSLIERCLTWSVIIKSRIQEDTVGQKTNF